MHSARAYIYVYIYTCICVCVYIYTHASEDPLPRILLEVCGGSKISQLAENYPLGQARSSSLQASAVAPGQQVAAPAAVQRASPRA